MRVVTVSAPVCVCPGVRARALGAQIAEPRLGPGFRASLGRRRRQTLNVAGRAEVQPLGGELAGISKCGRRADPGAGSRACRGLGCRSDGLCSCSGGHTRLRAPPRLPLRDRPRPSEPLAWSPGADTSLWPAAVSVGLLAPPIPCRAAFRAASGGPGRSESGPQREGETLPGGLIGARGGGAGVQPGSREASARLRARALESAWTGRGESVG